MPLYDYMCPLCKTEFEWMAKFDEIVKCPLCFDQDADKIFPKKSPSFKLVYNPKTDMVDFDGNRSRYYDDYKELKKTDKNARIPKLDGDG